MARVLHMFAELDDSDIDWLIEASSRRNVRPGEVLVQEGQPTQQLYIVLQGRLSVTLANGTKLGELGAGEAIGELSFVDSRPPIASVRGLTDASVLAVSTARVSARLRTNVPFAARFYRALSVFIADRLRANLTQAAGATKHALDEDQLDTELSPEFLNGMSIAANRFDRVMHRVMR